MVNWRQKKRLYIAVFVVISGLLGFNYFYIPVPVTKSLNQRLSLSLHVPTSLNDRGAIVQRYIDNLQAQITDIPVQNIGIEEDVYEARREHAKQYCKGQEVKRSLSPSKVQDLMWYLENPDIIYCPIAKAGSTFWRRAFEVVRRKDPNITSPFQLSYLDFKESNARFPVGVEHKDQFESRLGKTLKFLFARDPYSRVFSTYVDKILSPNSYMWGLGKKAILKFRANARENETCGADVTFEEFVKYLNSVPSKTFDIHVRPVSFKCDVCKFKYDVIGKMETFQTDTKYILDKVGSYGKEIIFREMNTEYKVDYIVDAVIRAFVFRSSWNKCISVHAGNQRLWRQLQIAGVIRKGHNYPLPLQQSESITVTEYLNMALEAYRQSGETTRRNKKEAFLQAYASVPLPEMEKLREQFITDFEMFDYEQKPKELFKLTKDRDGVFDYFDVMRLK